MKNIVFYVPHCGQNMQRYLNPVRQLPGVNLIGIGQDSEDYLNQLGNPFDSYIRLLDAVDPDQVEQAIAKIAGHMEIHALLNILEEQQDMLAALREKYDIPGIKTETCRRFRDKAYMKQILKENNILCADYKRVKVKANARKFVADHGLPVVIKPLGGCGAVDTYAIHDQAQFDSYLQRVQLSADHPAIIEEFIEGDEGSFETITLNGEIKFFSMTTYYPGPMQAMHNPWIQIIFNLNKDFMDHPDNEDIRQAGRAVIKALGLDTAVTHMEWFRHKSDGKIYIGEIAARPPGEPIPGLHNIAHDMSLHSAWAKIMALNVYDTKHERKYHASCARLRAQGTGQQILEIHGLDAVQQKVGHLIVDVRIPPIGEPKTDSYMGEGYIFCRGDNYEEVFAATRYITETVKIFC